MLNLTLGLFIRTAMESIEMKWKRLNGFRGDYSESFRFTAAANQGFAKGQFQVGMCYLEGCGVEEDNNSALQW